MMDHRCACAKSLSHIQLFATLWTVACQTPLSMGFFRQGYWSGLPCPSPGVFPSQGSNPSSPVAPALQGDSLLISHRESPMASQVRGLNVNINLWRVCCMTSQPKVSLASDNRLFISYLQVYDQIRECAFSQPKVVQWLVLSVVW